MDLTELVNLTELQRGQLRRIYHSAFPPEQREPFFELLKRSEASRVFALAHLVESEAVAFALLSPLAAARCFFLEYLMVSERCRNAGLGGQLLRQLDSELTERGEQPRIVLEAEHPDAAETAADAALRRRRIGFYERNGALLLPVDDYAMPSLQSGGQSQRMCLLWIGEGEPREEAELEALVESMYRDSYGLSLAHPLRSRRGQEKPRM